MAQDTPGARRTLTRPAKPVAQGGAAALPKTEADGKRRSAGMRTHAAAAPQPVPASPRRNVWRSGASAAPADDKAAAFAPRSAGMRGRPQMSEAPQNTTRHAPRDARKNLPDKATLPVSPADATPQRVRRMPLPPAVPTRKADIEPPRAAQLARRQPEPLSAHAAAGGIRLNKRMAEMGLCSRREADDWIAKGWVHVNGQPAETGQRVGVQDRITVEKAAHGQQAQRVTILMHKPVGYVSGQPEDGHQSAASLLNPGTHWRDDPSAQRFHPRQLLGLAPAGRLDIDSTGLLVLTQDGRVARTLIGEHSQVDKEYLVRVEYAHGGYVVSQNVQGAFPPDKLALLRHGLSLDGVTLKPALVDWQNPEQLRFVLTEGKKRQIRRMCEAVGLKVVGLKRVRIGRVMLGKLPVGQWRYLGADEAFA